MSKNSWLSAEWQSITSPSTGGSSASRRCWPKPPGHVGMASGGRWQVDETYVKVAGKWRYVYRAIDQFGQVIDVFVTLQRDAKAARRLFEGGLQHHQGDASGGHYRPSGNLPGPAGGAAAGGLAPHRAARQQPGRGRSRPPEGTAATDARIQAGP